VRWLRRAAEPERPDEPVRPDKPPPDPAAAIDEADRLINRSAGQLPVAATVRSRCITDTLRAILGATQQQQNLEVGTMILITTTATDYLPTTLGRYLAVDQARRDEPQRGSRSPADHLKDQLFDLHTAATEALAAVRDRDVDALRTQGAFLSTKFHRSDLDLD
jgi:hypothetical protein